MDQDLISFLSLVMEVEVCGHDEQGIKVPLEADLCDSKVGIGYHPRSCLR